GIAVGRVPVSRKYDGGSYVLHLNVINLDVFHRAAAREGRLEVDAHFGTLGLEVAGNDVADTARCFGAAGEEAAARPGYAVLDDDVFGGPVHAQAVGVAAGFQAKVIVVAV
nr:hypothetical protein [Tanacetum cinerariifolium]